MKFDSEGLADLLEQVEHEGHPRLFFWADDAIRHLAQVPKEWKDAQQAMDFRKAWSHLWIDLKQQLPRTIKLLDKKVVDLGVLVTDRSGPSLLYLFGGGRDVYARRGYSPVRTLPDISKRLPVDLYPLYGVHNGWVDFYSNESGPLPVERWKRFGAEGDKEGFLEIVSKGSDSLGFDLDEHPAKPYILRPDDDAVTPVEDFWQKLDAWLYGPMKSLPDA
jgi:hypothetical protein